MITDNTIYSVVHVRSKQVGGGLEEQETLEDRWFDSLENAERHFKTMSVDNIVVISNENWPRGMTTKRESKYLYKFGLGDEAKSLIAKNQKYDAQRLAWEINFDPRSGILLDQEPKQQDEA